MRARVDPGARGDRDDHFVGLGLVEDAREVLFGVAPHAHAVDAQAQLARVVVEEADRQETELAVAHDLARHHPPPLPGAGDQDGALALAPAEGGEGATLVHTARERAHADEEHQREQREQHDHAVGQDHGHGVVVRVAVDRAQHLDGHDRQQHDHDHRPDHRLVVALAGVAPAALVDPREDQHGQAPHEHPPDGVLAQVGVLRRRAAVEAQLEG